MALAFILILVWSPAELLSVGFQLSFLAVGGIIAFYEPIVTALSRLLRLDPEEVMIPWTGRARTGLGRAAVRALAAGLGAVAATTALAAYRFNLVTPLGMVLTVLLLPLVSILLVLGIFYVIVGSLSARVAEGLAFLVQAAANGFVEAVQGALRLGGAYFYVPTPGPLFLLATYGALVLFATRRRHGIRPAWVAIGILAAWNGLAWWTVFAPPPSEARVAVLDVGKGLATVTELPSGHVIVYDAGGYPYGRRAVRTVSRYLWDRGHSGVDVLVLSHPHADHVSGALGLLERFRVGLVVVSPTFASYEGVGSTVVGSFERAGVRVEKAEEGTALVGAGGTRIVFLGPPRDVAGWPENDRSLVLRIDPPGRCPSALFAGDAQARAIESFARDYRISAGFVLIPHHGLWSEGTELLARETGARVAVASSAVGYNYKRGSGPFAAEGARVYVTALDGAVICRLGRDGVVVERPKGRAPPTSDNGREHP
jgi:competence protein ComEC